MIAARASRLAGARLSRHAAPLATTAKNSRLTARTRDSGSAPLAFALNKRPLFIDSGDAFRTRAFATSTRTTGERTGASSSSPQTTLELPATGFLSAALVAGLVLGTSVTATSSSLCLCEEGAGGATGGGAASSGAASSQQDTSSWFPRWKSGTKIPARPEPGATWDASVQHQPELARSFYNQKPQKKDESRDSSDFMLLSGNANPRLARKIAKHLGVELAPALVTRFKDGETRIQIQQSCRGKDIFIIQPTCPPVNENLVELLFMISTARRASAKRITAVIPYYGYARADRKNSSRVPIAAADVANMIIAMGADRVLSVDLHNGAIQGFFPPHCPFDNLSAMSIGVEYFAREQKLGPRVCVISPDAGGVDRARQFQSKLMKYGVEDCKLAMISKQRIRPGEVASMDLVGDVRDRDVIIVDDLVDTAGTLCEAAANLKKHGARRIYAFVTHGVLSENALEKIKNSVLEELVVTDTINGDDGRHKVKNIKIASIAVLVADGLRRIYQNESLSWDVVGK
ncbi:unnamed protein product [Amoebophrya sp. A120]|nr:unnamed protein product [Amoebophrya sp. A120]|eukprot:GSA120T00022988001.1